MNLRIKRAVLVGIACIVACLLSTWVGLTQLPQSRIQLTTEPAIDRVVPFEAEAKTILGSGRFQPPVQLRFQALNPQGEPLKNAKIHLQVLTPPTTPGLTTDFPIVEGTELLDIEQDAPDGELQVRQVLPIRGTYRLVVRAVPTIENAFQPIAQTLTLKVAENPLKFLYFGILVVVLLILGFIGGWTIGGKQETQPGEIAPLRVRLLLSGATFAAIAALLFVSVSAELAQAHVAMPLETTETANVSIATSPGLKAQLLGDPHAIVGKPATLQVQVVRTQDDRPVGNVKLKVKATQLENDWVTFAFTGTTDANGQLQWRSQFFDGAPHQLEIAVLPSGGAEPNAVQPFTISREIDVEAVAPPLSVRLTGLFYFTGFLTVGVLLGLWLRRNRMQHQSV